ncbi:MAG: GrpB family protein [Verrucomicrobiota bacterium]
MKEAYHLRNVSLAPWSPGWVEAFDEESKTWRWLLGSLCLDIEYIGSTVVRGLRAKPIVDMMVVVSSCQDLDRRITGLARKGYESRARTGFPVDAIFKKT